VDKGPQFGDFLAQHGFTPEEQKKSSGMAEFLQKNADIVRSKFAKKMEKYGYADHEIEHNEQMGAHMVHRHDDFHGRVGMNPSNPHLDTMTVYHNSNPDKPLAHIPLLAPNKETEGIHRRYTQDVLVDTIAEHGDTLRRAVNG
jgi:hypothetical protein